MTNAKATYILRYGTFGESRRELFFKKQGMTLESMPEVVMGKLRQKHGHDAELELISIDSLF